MINGDDPARIGARDAELRRIPRRGGLALGDLLLASRGGGG
jgi:hypothetical protein